jgi:hypothetical protein
MALSLLPIHALAADGTGEDAATPEDQSEDLFYEYMLQLAREETAQSSPVLMERKQIDTAGAKLDGYARILYDELAEKISDIAQNGGSTVISIPYTAFGIAAGNKWTYSYWGASDWDGASEAFKKFLNDVKNSWGDVADALLVDCPYALYWYDKTEGNTFGGQGYSGDGTNIFVDDPSFVITLYVASEYADGGDNTVVSRGMISSYQVATAVSTAKQIVAENASKLDYEKLEAYKDAICGLVSYNTAAAENANTPYGNPWQLVYVFDGDETTNVVCEGYSKAFKFLCDLSDFRGKTQCYLVTGFMAGGTGAGRHMWNIVTLWGKNYLADVTNCDGDTVTDFLYLKGVTRPVSGGSTYGGRYADYTIPKYSTTISYWYDSDLVWNTADQSILELSTADFDPELEPTEPSEFGILDLSVDPERGSVTAKVKNHYGDDALLIVAVYDAEGKMLECACTPLSLAMGQESSCPVSLSLAGWTEVSVFIVDADTFAPLCEPIDAELAG